jgi:hypothetical protein
MDSWTQGVGHSVLRSIHHRWGTMQDQFASRITFPDTASRRFFVPVLKTAGRGHPAPPGTAGG